MTARLTRRMSSSLLPLNMTPAMTSIHPPLWWKGPLGPLMSGRDPVLDSRGWCADGQRVGLDHRDRYGLRGLRGRYGPPGRFGHRGRRGQTDVGARHAAAVGCRVLRGRDPPRRNGRARQAADSLRPLVAERALFRVRVAPPPRARPHRIREGAVPETGLRAAAHLPPAPRAALHAMLPLCCARDAPDRA